MILRLKFTASVILRGVDRQYGPVAHLVERLICTEEAGGSNPLGSTITKIPQILLGNFCNEGAFGRGFESRTEPRAGGGVADT